MLADVNFAQISAKRAGFTAFLEYRGIVSTIFLTNGRIAITPI
jgi:hypothetical protein